MGSVWWPMSVIDLSTTGRSPAGGGIRSVLARTATPVAAATMTAIAATLASCAGSPEPAGPPAPTSASASPTTPTISTPTTSPGHETSTVPPVRVEIRDIRWITLGGRSSLEVDPGPPPRRSADAESARTAWEAIVAADPRADQPGMWEQFLCHAQFAISKKVWHLEPWRPAMTYPQTVAALCNPGPVPDSDAP